MKKYFLISILVLICLAGVFYFFFENKKVAQIGTIAIFQNQIKYRDQLIRLEYPQEKRELGLLQLTKAAVNEQILLNYGIEITEDLLLKEEARINQNTRNPHALQKIKDLFKKDHKAYLQTFVRPTLVNRTIYYDLFSKDERFHQESFDQATSYLKVLTNEPDQFEEFARKNHFQIATLEVSKKYGLIWNRDRLRKKIEIKDRPATFAIESEKTAEENEQIQFWVEHVAKNLKPLKIYSELVSTAEHWQIIRYSDLKENNIFKFEVLHIPKQNFEQWREKEKNKIK